MPGRNHPLLSSLLPSLMASVALLTAAGCGSTASPTARSTAVSTASDGTATSAAGAASTGAGIRLVPPAEALALQQAGADDLVVLDIRTAEEFATGHLERAIMIDFYAADFAQQLAALDPAQPYLLYCNSGNRSGQARALMDELGFTDVAEVDGGIVAWLDAGLPVVTP